MIQVTKPFLPPEEEYISFLNEIWKNNWLTNDGPLLRKLENEIGRKLNSHYLQIVNNGTMSLQLIFQALELEGEVITSPFSYVATVSSLVWEGLDPVFCDIDPDSWNIDVKRIESLITNKTSAILATHVFGNPCELIELERVARKNNLKLIYDSSHAFGVKSKGHNIGSFGDASATSLHATKLFHMVEGGIIETSDKDLSNKINYMRNFGHKNPLEFYGLGINAKNSEFHSAMGLACLPYLEEIIAKRKKLYMIYLEKLDAVTFQKISENTQYNYSYVPVIFESENVLNSALSELNKHEIYPRRYFYPVLNQLPYVKYSECVHAEDIASRILCLPTYFDLNETEVEEICEIINQAIE